MPSKPVGANEIIYACLMLVGIGIVVKGIVAKTFTEQSVGWWPGREQFKPKWYHRVIMAGVGLFCFLYSLHSLWSRYGK